MDHGNQIEQANFFQLVGPEDYTQDFLDDTQRRESCTVQRCVGSFFMNPIVSTEDRIQGVGWKAVIFTAGDEEIEEAFADDPTQFNFLTDVTRFVDFCRRFSVMHVIWFDATTSYFEAPAPFLGITTNRPMAMYKEWDIRVKRKLTTDQAVWLLISSIAIQPNSQSIRTDVESRVLIHD